MWSKHSVKLCLRNVSESEAQTGFQLNSDVKEATIALLSNALKFFGSMGQF